MRKIIATAVAALGFALTLGATSPQTPSPGVVSPNAGVANHGQEICPSPSNPNPWVGINGTPRLRAISAGACIVVPTDGHVGMTIERMPNNGQRFTYPNISSGYQLGQYDCPEMTNKSMCPTYPVPFVKDGYPTLTISEYSVTNYDGNLSSDEWLMPSATDTDYASRCALPGVPSAVEVMIWYVHHNDIAIPDTAGQYSTRIDGRRWKVYMWRTGSGCPAGEGWRLVIIMAPRLNNGNLVVRHVHLNKFYSYVMHRGWVSKSYYLTAQNVGWEMLSGGVGNRIINVTLKGTK